MSSISRSVLSLGLAAVAGAALVSDASAMRGFGGGGRGGFGGHFGGHVGGHATVAVFHPAGIGHGPVFRGPIFRRPVPIGSLLPPVGRPPRGPIPVGWPPRHPQPWPPRGPHWPPIIIGWHPHHVPIIPVGLIAAPVAVGAVATGVTTGVATGVATSVATVAAPAQGAVACGTTGSFVAVVFVPTVTAADITTFLKSYNVTMADGPDANGVYRIRLSDTVLPATQVAEVLASMRTQTAIVSTVAGV